MKPSRTLLCAAVALAFTATATASKDGNILTDYFQERMSGLTPEMPRFKKLSPANIPSAEKEVWKAWQKACAATDQPLPAPEPLADKSVHSWTLPDSLEPSATMNFIYGYKGDTDLPTRPLFLYLHGSGPRDREFENGKILSNRWVDAPSVYFVPQIPQEGGWYRWYQKSKQWAWEHLLRQALATGYVNPDKVYFLGISEGGYGSQRLASFYADYLAGAGPMAGGEPLKNAPVENLSNTAFMLRTGELDYGFYRDRLTRATGAALDSMQRLYPGHYEHLVRLEPARGHGIDYSLTAPWLRAHTRNPYPRHFLWEDFEMDGRYRQGFYNIQTDGTDRSSRRVYEVDINDNHVDIKVDCVTYTCTETDPRWGIQLLFAKTFTPAPEGELTVYLNDKLFDPGREVTVTVNSREVFHGRILPSMASMAASCALFGDPRRIFPYAVKVKF